MTPQLSMQLVTFAAEAPASWQPLLDLARMADAAGIDRLVVSDHVVFGEDLDAYGNPAKGGIAGGKQPTGPDGHWLEPLTFLSHVSAMTSHSRLATGILIAALRRPTVLAKTAATLDVLSGGRLDLAVGVGWQEAEYLACGLDFGTRGKLLDHTLEVCQALWREQAASHHSDYLDFDHIHNMPKPITPGGVPIWVSGTLNKRVLNRLVRFGSGWVPWGSDAAAPAEGVATIRAAFREAGRSADDLQVTTGLPAVRDDDGSLDLGRTMAGVPALVEAGITDFRAAVKLPDRPDAAQGYLDELVGTFRAAVA